MRKKIFAATSLMLITLVILSTGTSYAFKNEPDGFRGIKWGTDINTLSNMTVVNSDGDTHTYERTGDEMKIGNAELAVLTYFFGKENFVVLQSKQKDILIGLRLEMLYLQSLGRDINATDI